MSDQVWEGAGRAAGGRKFARFAGAIFLMVAALPPAVADDDDERPRNGVVVRFESQDGAAFSRVEPLVALHGQGAAESRVSGRTQVRWQARLKIVAEGEYRLALFVRGAARVRLDGNEVIRGEHAERAGWLVSQPLRLDFGYLPLVVEHTSVAETGLSDTDELRLFWEGPRFSREPLGPQWLFLDPEQLEAGEVAEAERLEQGRIWTRALRCSACHEIGGEPPPLAAPALDRLAGQLRPEWLAGWLRGDHRRSDDPVGEEAGSADDSRRMPQFSVSDEEVASLAAYLLQAPRGPAPPQEPAPEGPSGKPDRYSSRATQQGPPDGELLFFQVGCLACHRLGELGTGGPFGGGDLSRIAEKRPPEFFESWLDHPELLNRDRRMPTFALAEAERRALSVWLSKQGAVSRPAAGVGVPAEHTAEQVAEGKRLFGSLGCARCHRGPDGGPQASPRTPLRGLDHHDACWGAPRDDAPRGRPGYQLDEQRATAIRAHLASLVDHRPAKGVDGSRRLAESNCLSCHARDGGEGIGAGLPSIVATQPRLAARLPALSPPALTSAGDKFVSSALLAAVARRGAPRRDWLDVRMPRFPLADGDLSAIVEHLVEVDRVPEDVDAPPPVVVDEEASRGGERLVTADGFGCISCHAVGSVRPPNAPLNASGPDLLGLGGRLRREWFDRWVRNPARIVPRMEMPSVQLPVHGVLDDQLDRQLAAVWAALNRPGFRPPEPNPVRIVRRSGLREASEWAAVVTDVTHLGEEVLVAPLVIGLPNRHNLLYDLESATLRGWWIGDTARQRTRGKAWHWETGGVNLLPDEPPPSGATGSAGTSGAGELRLLVGDDEWTPRTDSQFLTELDAVEQRDGGLRVEHRLRFAGRVEDAEPVQLRVTQTWRPIWSTGRRGPPDELRGFERAVEILDLPARARLALHWAPRGADLDRDRRGASLGPNERIELGDSVTGEATVDDQRRLVITAADEGRARVVLRYLSTQRPDTFPQQIVEPPPPPATPLHAVPGFEGIRLPIAEQWMPTGLAWRADGALVVTSLKGEVWLARDSDGDGLEDRWRPLCDDLAAPFGVATSGAGLDVIGKWGLVRLVDRDGDDRYERWETLASGWGHTADYHDWAIGLPPTGDGGYWVATACQQDQRTQAAAKWRGVVLRLDPREPTPADPRRFTPTPVSFGHRFPIGVARRGDGELFVTDNQGNYNPFNELNHVRPGRHFGFINALERGAGAPTPPPATPAAVELPHPWTRSVNGICFLEAHPMASGDNSATSLTPFGPYTGHLIGCEYDTRRLIRLSLQEVGGVLQGAAYPFSVEAPAEGPPLLGPLCAAVSPAGDLFVGGIRDSGWGGANNIGELVRLRPHWETLPAGIVEVRAVADGLHLSLTGELDAHRIADTTRYLVASYRRVATPDYGGPDVDRRTERVLEATPDSDGRGVRLRLGELRAGFVYELYVKSLAPEGRPFFPAEAHYTMRVVP